MDLIERYLSAVRWNLPAARADDIVAELADLIASRIEDREEALGRPLDKAETSALLREFGHPLAVAGRYHGQRALIGTELFPFYWFALRVVLAIVAVIEAIETAGRIIAGNQPLAQALSQGIAGGVGSLLVNGAVVTLVFAIIERTGLLAAYLERWKPEELPALRLPPARRKRPWEPLFEIAFGIGFLLWWVGAFAVPLMPRDAHVAIVSAPVWATLYWPVIALIALRTLLALITLLRPGWKPLRAAIMLVCTAGTIAIATILYQAGRILIVTPLSTSATQAARVQESLDLALHITVVIVGAVAVWQCAVELWKLYREG